MSWFSKMVRKVVGDPSAEEAVGDDEAEGEDSEELSFGEQLLHEVIERILQDGRIADVARIEGEIGFTATDRDGMQLTGYLNNLLADTQEMDDEERAERVDFYVSAMFERLEDQKKPRTMETTTPRLRLVLRRADVICDPHIEQDPFMYRAVLPNVVELVAEDMGNAIGLMRHRSLEELGTTYPHLRELALANMQALPLSITRVPELPNEKLFMIADDDEYEAARLTSPQALEEIAKLVNGRPVIGIPHRTLCLFAGSDDVKAVEHLIALTLSEYEASPRSISCVPYVYNADGTLAELSLAKDDANYGAIQHARYTHAAQTYGSQQETLNEMTDENGAFHASYKVVAKDDVLSSYAVWSHDVITSLPVADAIAFNYGDKGHVLVPFDKALELCGHLLEKQSYFPERWLTHGYPDDALWKQLETLSLI